MFTVQQCRDAISGFEAEVKNLKDQLSAVAMAKRTAEKKIAEWKDNLINALAAEQQKKQGK